MARARSAQWRRAPSSTFVALDFETADEGFDSACAVALVRVEKQVIVHRESCLIRPPRKIFQFTYLHGISWTRVEQERSFAEVWPDLDRILEGAEFLAAHNASFDSSVLQTCCRLARIATPQLPFECTVTLARKIWNIYPTKLPNVCTYLRLPLSHHDPCSDAEACARIILEAWRALSGLESITR